MPELADIFRGYGPGYMEKFSQRMLPSHIRALQDICQCRTPALGEHMAKCNRCGYKHSFYHLCYNRSCPKCQNNHAQKWLEKRKSQLLSLPVNYFHVVFTLPKELHPIVRSNQVKMYDIFFKAASYALIKLLADPHYGGGKPGLLCVLHTWTRPMGYHPHLHFLVPAGVIQLIEGVKGVKQYHWRPIERTYLVPFTPLADIFRARFIKLARKALPNIKFPHTIWKKQWVIYCKSTLKLKSRKRTDSKVLLLEYLARYLYRIAITNRRILSIKNGKVTFLYQNSKDHRWKTMTLDANEFIRRFLQHVLPKGFHKVRYYGFLAPASRHILLSLIRKLSLSPASVSSSSSSSSLSFSSNGDSHNQDRNQQSLPNYHRKCPRCKTGDMVVIVQAFFRKNPGAAARPPP
jgi:predicted Zn-ribbon and HTH transcriptional regulator